MSRRRDEVAGEGGGRAVLYVAAAGGGLLLAMTAAVVIALATHRGPLPNANPEGPWAGPGPAAPAPPAWEEARQRGEAGAVSVDLAKAGRRLVGGFRFGQHRVAGTLLVARLVIRNTSPTRVVRFGGWHGDVTAEDEHGNRFRPHLFGAGWEFPSTNTLGDGAHPPDCDDSAVTAGEMALHPNRGYVTYLFFEAPPAQSREVRLALPRRQIEGGGEGDLRLRVAISE